MCHGMVYGAVDLPFGPPEAVILAMEHSIRRIVVGKWERNSGNRFRGTGEDEYGTVNFGIIIFNDFGVFLVYRYFLAG